MIKGRTPEMFIVGEWVEFSEGETRRKVQVTVVDGNQVTARVYGKPMVFVPRDSDGTHVKVGSANNEAMPAMIVRPAPAPEKKNSRWKDIRDFFHGMFWAP